MQLTDQTDRFDRAYRDGSPPWVIDEPQPAVVGLMGADGFRGRVLDLGCGAGEHAVLLAERGFRVVGADASPTALALAAERAAARGVDARFAQVDVLDPASLAALGTFDTVLDSALFHVFGADDQARYADGLRGVCAPGAVVHLLALARTAGREFGPVIDRSAILAAFSRPGWEIDAIVDSTYRGVVTESQAEDYGAPVGTVVDVPAWLARIHRVE